MNSGQELYFRARQIIPGGTQLLSKRPEMFLPDQWPSYYVKAEGIHVWDLDGRRYKDFTHFGVGACVLGYADPDVNAAVDSVIRQGVMCTLNCPEEVQLAELLIELHPWAEMVRFSRAGGEALAIAIRIARAATGRDKIAFCGYHGWHDWYLSANLADEKALDGHLLAGLAPAGVPRGLRGTLLPFHFNNIAEFQSIISEHGSDLAAVVMEPARDCLPDPTFLQTIRSETRERGIVLIFDEVTSGWRMNTGGIHMMLNVAPDMAVFAKAMGNGFAISAIIGTRSAMDAAQKSFISSTNWTERVGPTAALATIRKHRRLDVPKHLIQVGTAVRQAWLRAAKQHGLHIHVSGIEPLSHFSFDCPDPAAAMTLFIQGMLDRHYLAGGSYYSSYAHQPADVESYAAAVNEVFQEIASALHQGNIRSKLRGGVKHSTFQRLTDAPARS